MFLSLDDLLTTADNDKSLPGLVEKLQNNRFSPTALASREDTQLYLRFAFRLLLLPDSEDSTKAVKTDIGWLLLQAANGEFVKELIDERVVGDLLKNNTKNFNIGKSVQVPKVISWLIRHNPDITMTVKQNIGDFVEYGTDANIENILSLMELFRQNPDILPQGDQLLTICRSIVTKLGDLDLPSAAEPMRKVREDVEKVGGFLAEIVNLNRNDYNPIVFACLTTLQQLLSRERRPSSAVTIVLRVVEDQSITKAVECLLTHINDDESVMRAVISLCFYLTNLSFSQKLNAWIMDILDGLRQQNKFDLLLNITLEIIERLTLALIIPYHRQHVAPVVYMMLLSVKHTPVVFNKAIRRIPNVLKHLRTTDKEGSTFKHLVKIVGDLIVHFGSDNELYKETVALLNEWKVCCDDMPQLHSVSWSYWDYGTGYGAQLLNNTNARVGLVNLGNTCYMNSVLQALMMTKQFSREVLLSDCDSPLHLKVRQLLALLLHSSRPELTPQEVLLAARPSDFFPGHQQDSSEFLGHLLETLHEQEKRNLKKPTLPIGKWETQSDLAANNAGDDMIDTKTDESDGASKSDAAATLIQKTFAGRIAITNECKECGATNSHFDSFRDLQLSFPDDVVATKEDQDRPDSAVKTVHSVQTLLDFYCSTEQLTGDNQYFCDKCRKLCDGERSIQIVEPPKSLILTLKHFRYDQRFHTRAKLMQKVLHDEVIEVPVNGRRLIYSLYAAVIHSGSSLDCGHYYTIATDGKWYKFNDNFVTESSIGELHALAPPNTPYILFYQLSNKSPANTPESDVAPAPCNGTTDTECQLDLEELPTHLRDFVNKDNISFKEEVQRLKKPHQLVQNWPVVSKKHYRDSDDDPPPNCGDKAIDCHNRYIC